MTKKIISDFLILSFTKIIFNKNATQRKLNPINITSLVKDAASESVIGMSAKSAKGTLYTGT